MSISSRRHFTRLMGGVLIGGAGALAVQATLANFVRVGIDPDEDRCLPWRTYVMLEGRPEPVKAGTLVRFSPGELMNVPGKGPANGGRDVIKLVVAVGGDTVEIRSDRALVNGFSLGDLVEKVTGVEMETAGLCNEVVGKLGKSLDDFERVINVPDDAVFVVGTSRRSFDSRYWGVLPVANINARVLPVI